ncbi:MAG: hypothetical protein K2X39_07930, partial [Silvanigrellaceae bacterium]|nr:hypothetical protein [Silvanigrellaceae bacterium]
PPNSQLNSVTTWESFSSVLQQLPMFPESHIPARSVKINPNSVMHISSQFPILQLQFYTPSAPTFLFLIENQTFEHVTVVSLSLSGDNDSMIELLKQAIINIINQHGIASQNHDASIFRIIVTSQTHFALLLPMIEKLNQLLLSHYLSLTPIRVLLLPNQEDEKTLSRLILNPKTGVIGYGSCR